MRRVRCDLDILPLCSENPCSGSEGIAGSDSRVSSYNKCVGDSFCFRFSSLQLERNGCTKELKLRFKRERERERLTEVGR